METKELIEELRWYEVRSLWLNDLLKEAADKLQQYLAQESLRER